MTDQILDRAPLTPRYDFAFTPEQRASLRQRQVLPLRLLASGLRPPEIGKRLGVSGDVARQYLGELPRRLGEENALTLFKHLVSGGEFRLDEFVPKDFDPSSFGNLKGIYKEVAKGIIHGDDYGKIGRAINSPVEFVRQVADTVREVVGARNNFQIFVLSLQAENVKREALQDSSSVDFEVDIFDKEGYPVVAKTETQGNLTPMEALSYYSQGLGVNDIRKMTPYLERKDIDRLLKQACRDVGALEVSGRLSEIGAIKIAIEKGLIDTGKIFPGGEVDIYQLDQLDGNERKILRGLASEVSPERTGEGLGLNPEQIKEAVERIRQKTGARRTMQAVAMYHAIKDKKVKDAVSKGEDPSRVEVFGPLRQNLFKD